MTPASRSPFDRPAFWVLIFYAALYLLSASGRMSSGDATGQLQATLLLRHTGRLSSPTPFIRYLWLKSPTGVYYEIHDIGAVGAMFPAALLGSAISTASEHDQIASPSLPTRLAVAFTYCLIGALGPFFLYRLFALFYSARTAFLVSLFFGVCTMYWPYTKTARDVLPGCVCVCAMLFYAGRLALNAFSPPATAITPTLRQNALSLGIATGLALAFRVSLAPFLLLGIAGLLVALFRRLPRSVALHVA
ncbi:MAG: hypothetical protein H8F28_22170, partial [Fibrella sp.]|nr:hypothetical protein [Armatimonadota bacterium]